MLKTGLLVSAIIVGLTVFVGVGGLFLGIQSFGFIDYVMYPGCIGGWFYIWGDSYSNSVAQRLTAIGVSVAVNAFIGFIIGILVGAVLRFARGKKSVEPSTGGNAAPPRASV